MTYVTTADQTQEPAAFEALKIIAFTGFGIVATSVAFVFFPPAGALLGAMVAWRGMNGIYGHHDSTPLKVLSLIGFTVFSIVATVLGFVFFAPSGLVIAALALWFGFGGFSKAPMPSHVVNTPTPSGNRAFDAYKVDTLKRLEAEQTQFESFLVRLRDAKDKTEFDQFIDDRAYRASTPAA